MFVHEITYKEQLISGETKAEYLMKQNELVTFAIADKKSGVINVRNVTVPFSFLLRVYGKERRVYYFVIGLIAFTSPKIYLQHKESNEISHLSLPHDLNSYSYLHISEHKRQSSSNAPRISDLANRRLAFAQFQLLYVTIGSNYWQ